MTIEDPMDEVIEAENEASEVLHLAIWGIAARNGPKNIAITLLGIELALLRHAARLALIQKECCGGQKPKETFLHIARSNYDEIKKLYDESKKSRIKDKNKPDEKPPKPPLTVVK